MAIPKGDPGNVTDEPKSEPGGDSLGADFLKGYAASTTDSADAPDYPGNQVWAGPGSSAVAYKAHWKNKPPIFPYGSNDEGGK